MKMSIGLNRVSLILLLLNIYHYVEAQPIDPVKPIRPTVAKVQITGGGTDTPLRTSPTPPRKGPASYEDLSKENSYEENGSDGHTCDMTFKVLSSDFSGCSKTSGSLESLKADISKRLKEIEDRVNNIADDDDITVSLKQLENKVYTLQAELDKATDLETQTLNHPAFREIVASLEKEQSVRQSLEKRLQELETRNQDIDCRLMGRGAVFQIRPLRGSTRMTVYCDSTWLLIQRRINGSVDFYRGWSDYKRGFGDISGEFWLGNDNIHRLTTQSRYKLRIDMLDGYGRHYYAEYSHFWVENESENYRLHLSGFTGNIVDSMIRDGSSYNHNGMTFTTYDRNHGPNEKVNCAEKYRGGWWYNNCYVSNLNGRWCEGTENPALSCIIWYGMVDKHLMEQVTMKIQENL